MELNLKNKNRKLTALVIILAISNIWITQASHTENDMISLSIGNCNEAKAPDHTHTTITPPTNLSITNTTTSSVKVNWNAVPNIGTYEIQIYQPSIDETSISIVRKETFKTINYLYPRENYRIRIRAINSEGNKSQYSTWFNFKTLDETERPSTVQNLKHEYPSSNSVSLRWNTATDNHPQGIEKYAIINTKTNTIHSFVDQINLYRTDDENAYVFLQNLTPETDYSFAIRAYDYAGNQSSQYSNEVSFTTSSQTPTAPTGLHTSEITLSSAKFKWNPTPNIYSSIMEIYRFSDKTSNSYILPQTTTIETDTPLYPNENYRVRIINKTIEGYSSEPSEWLNFKTPQDTERPTTVTNLTYENVTSTTVNISWNPAEDNNQIGVKHYTVIDSDQNTIIATTESNQNYITVNKLTPNTTYRFKVRAHDYGGNQSLNYSNEITFTTNNTNSPTPPNGLTVSETTSYSSKVSWNESLHATAYKLEFKGEKTRNGRAFFVHSETNSGISTRFFSNENIQVRVLAINSEGVESDFSPWHSFKTLKDTKKPSAVQNIKAINIEGDNVTLSWNSSIDDHPQEIGRYDIIDNNNVVRASTKGRLGAEEVELYIGSLKPNTTYNFRIRAYDHEGNPSDYSDKITFTTYHSITPPVPTNLNATRIMPHKAVLIWDKSIATSYYEMELHSLTTGKTERFQLGVIGDRQRLNPNENYRFRVRSFSGSHHASEFSYWFSFESPKDNSHLLSPVDTLTYDNLTANSVRLSWDHAFHTTGIKQYDIINEFDNTVYYTVRREEGQIPNTIILENLTPDTEYSFSILPYDDYHNTSFRDGIQIYFITPENTDKPLKNAKSKQSEFKIYPIPAQNTLTTVLPISKSELAVFTIIDMKGRIIASGSYTSQKDIDITELNSGMYVIKIRTEKETYTKQFIKKN